MRKTLCTIMKLTRWMIVMPFVIVSRLALGLMAFFSSIASSLLGLTVSVFVLLAVVEFAIGYWQNGIAFVVLAFLASPIELPAIANFLLNLADRILGLIEGPHC